MFKNLLQKCFKKSIWVYHTNTGACNGCDIEVINVLTPYYDAERFGIKLVGTPRYADALLVSGPVTRQVLPALKNLYDSVPDPKLVFAIGSCAAGGGIWYDTYNVMGGTKDCGSVPSDVIEVVKEASPDILVIQEVAEFQDADGAWHSALSQIAQAGDFGKHVHFGPTVCMREHTHVQQSLSVHGIFSDWQDWRKGNAILSRWEFVQLGAPSKPGIPRNVPLYQTPLYQGTRDTALAYSLAELRKLRFFGSSKPNGF